jgi:hypothetical protein
MLVALAGIRFLPAAQGLAVEPQSETRVQMIHDVSAILTNSLPIGSTMRQTIDLLGYPEGVDPNAMDHDHGEENLQAGVRAIMKANDIKIDLPALYGVRTLTIPALDPVEAADEVADEQSAAILKDDAPGCLLRNSSARPHGGTPRSVGISSISRLANARPTPLYFPRKKAGPPSDTRHTGENFMTRTGITPDAA